MHSYGAVLFPDVHPGIKKKPWWNEKQRRFAFLRRGTVGEDRISAEKEARTWDENFFALWKFYQAQDFGHEIPNNIPRAYVSHL